MTMTVQPRHIKLALAGRQKNWTYAAYELHELQEAFDRAAKAWPQWQSVPIADLMTAATKEPIASLAGAIKAVQAIGLSRPMSISPTPAMPAIRRPTGRWS